MVTINAIRPGTLCRLAEDAEEVYGFCATFFEGAPLTVLEHVQGEGVLVAIHGRKAMVADDTEVTVERAY